MVSLISECPSDIQSLGSKLFVNLRTELFRDYMTAMTAIQLHSYVNIMHREDVSASSCRKQGAATSLGF